jgi:hypothetical protein
LKQYLSENQVVEWIDSETESHGRLERILWADPIRDLVVTIQINDDKALPVKHTYTEYVELLEAKPHRWIEWVDAKVNLSPDTEIPDKHREIRDKSWELIKGLVEQEPDVYDARLRGVMISEIKEKTGVHKSSIYKYLRRYWQSGKIKNALLPHYQNCGGNGQARKSSGVKRGRPPKFSDSLEGINIDEQILQLFRSGIRLFYDTREKAPLKRAYQQTLEKFFNVGYRHEGNVTIPILPPQDRLPTFGQFKYWFYKNRDLVKSFVNRYGKKRYELSARPVLGSSTYESFGPGSRFQIDATICDIYLVNQFRREWIIGKPIVYVVIDVFSRYITGVYVGLEGPSWLGAMMALANTTMDKVQFCAEYGIEIEPEEWACNHLPQMFTADRGELEGYMPNHLIDALGVKIENAPPYRADWKGIVEQQFRLLNLRSVKWIPGAVKERERERGERDYRLDAKLTLHEFTQIVIRSILYHNNQHYMRWYDRNEFLVADDVKPIPRELWFWGIENRTGRLKKVPEELVKLNLMYSGNATVTGAGIRFKGMHYSCDIALKEQWFVKARTQGTWNVPVRYDPRLTDRIYLWLDNGRKFETCSLLEREERYKHRRFEEVEDLLAIERNLANAREYDNVKGKIELDAFTRAIVQEAEKRTDQALREAQISKNKRISGVRARRQEEKESNRQREAFRLGETEKMDHSSSSVVSIQSRKPSSHYIPPSNKLSKIKAYLQEEEGDST